MSENENVQGSVVNSFDQKYPGLVSSWLPIFNFAERIGTKIPTIRGAIERGRLLGVCEGQSNVWLIPEKFIIPAHMSNPADVGEPIINEEGKLKEVILPSLHGCVTQLRDQKLSDEEILVWLFTKLEYLAQSPIELLIEGNRSAVRRAAQFFG